MERGRMSSINRAASCRCGSVAKVAFKVDVEVALPNDIYDTN